LCWEGNTRKARKVLDEALENIKKPESMLLNSLADYNVYCGNYQGALGWLSLKPKDTDTQFNFIPTALRYAQIYGYMNRRELAKKYYEEARSILETKIQERPEDERFHSALGIAYAGLGRKEDAIREGKLGVELLPVSKEAYRGTYRVESLARIYAMVGEFDAAIDQIEYLLLIPSELSIPLLRLDPAWNPLRDHPRFKKLVEAGK
jgi:tetratricopeptide (TPR) repeat protein